MKSKGTYLYIAFGLGLGLSIALLWVLGSTPTPATAAPLAELHVCPSGCTYSSVQDAVDAAGDGDVIKVAAGTYTGANVRARNDLTTTGVVTQVVYVSKTVTIQGGYTTTNWITSDPEANPTTLDAQGQGRVFYVVGDVSPVIDGFRITGGDASGMGGEGTSNDDTGGGIYVDTATATVTNNRIFSNSAACGGGVYAGMRGGGIASGATIVGNTIFSNTTVYDGGGVFLSSGDALVQRNTIRNNDGSGVFVLLGNHRLDGNVIRANTAHENGGGVFLQGTDATTLTNNVIADNHVAGTEGCGLYSFGSGARLLNNTIADNTGGNGSGIYATDWGAPSPHRYSDVTLVNTILVSQSVGIEVTGENTVTVNGILWYDTPITVSQSATATVSAQNQVTGDPAFTDPDAGDYHIGAGSAARDAGVDSEVSTDIDGQWRPMGPGHDLGADEYAGAGLDVAKQSSLEFVNRGETLTYTIVVTSAGTDDATGVVVTDTLDSWQRPFAALSSAGGCTIPDAGWGGSAVCTPGTIVTGTRVVITLTAEVSTSVPLEQEILNTAVVKANETSSSNAQATAYVQDCHVRVNAGATEYPDVQAAVDAAGPGDVVKVAGTCMGVNTYAGLRQQVYVDESITVRGGYTTTNWTTSDPEANPATLNALGEGRVLYITGDISPTVEGLRITGGDAVGLGGGLGGSFDAGAGVYIISATATISDNRIYGNHAGQTMSAGGGVHLQNSSSIVAGNTISGNSACFGGGVQAHLTSGNSSRNVVKSNVVESNTAHWHGAGMCLWGGDDVIGNIVVDNTTTGSGGGMHVGSSGVNTFFNNVVADNHAGIPGSGLYVDGSSQHWHTTVARNTGGGGIGIYVREGLSPASVAFTNTILVQHSVGISVTGGNTVTVNGILWHATPTTVSQSLTATVEIQNQLTGDPAFAADGYHVTAASAAMDAGIDAGVTTDVDGHLRPYNTAPDLGADEIAAVTIPTDTGSSLVYTDTQESSTAIQVPADAVTETIILVYTPADIATAPAGFDFAGKAFDLEAYQGEILLPGFAFSLPVTITLHYADADVDGLDEGTLLLEYWNEGATAWEDAADTCAPSSTYDRHPDENWLAVPVCHLTRFALFGREYTVYLPLVVRDY